MHHSTDPRPSGQPGGSVDDALLELDREMRALQQKMDTLRQPPAQPQPPVPPQQQAAQPQQPVHPQQPAQQPAPARQQAPAYVPPATPPAQRPAPAAAQPPAQPQQPRQAPQPSRELDWIEATGADVRRLRDSLNRLTRELTSAVDDLLAGIETARSRGESAGPTAPPQHAPAAAPQHAPATPPQHTSAAPPPAPELPPPAMQPPTNAIELDAGPFDDLVALSRFEQALGDLPGVEDVYVKSYAMKRAVIEITVNDRHTVVDEMQVHLPYQLDAGTAPDGKVIVHLHAPAVDQGV